MRWPLAVVLIAGLAAACSGCRSSGASDLVEAELRAKQQDLNTLRTELDRSEAQNAYLQRELRNQQQCGVTPPPADGIGSGARLKAITLGRGTGGYEEDGLPGDEALQVVLEPKDVDNHTVKAPGNVQVHALEITTEGIKRPLCSWPISGDQLRKSWRSGLLSTGYHLILPWKNWPTTPKLRIVVQFIGEDDRVFEADKDVTVRLAPGGIRKMPGAEETPPPMPPDSLPNPRKVEPVLPGPELPTVVPSQSQKPKEPVTAIPVSNPRPLKGAVELLRPIPITEDPVPPLPKIPVEID